jgi:hypothetical protein
MSGEVERMEEVGNSWKFLDKPNLFMTSFLAPNTWKPIYMFKTKPQVNGGVSAGGLVDGELF